VKQQADEALATHMDAVMSLLASAAESERAKAAQDKEQLKAAYRAQSRERDDEHQALTDASDDLRETLEQGEAKTNAALDAAAALQDKRAAAERERDRLAGEAQRLAAENARLAAAIRDRDAADTAGRDDGCDDLVPGVLGGEVPLRRRCCRGGARIVQGVIFSQNAEPEAPPSADAGGAASTPCKPAVRGRRKQGGKGDPPKSGVSTITKQPGDATGRDTKITRVAAGTG
jgi:hypothetical protein